MSLRRVLALAALVLSFSAAGCGEQRGEDPSPDAEATAADSKVRVVDEADANFVLHVSNQSYDDETVRIEVVVDDVTVVDGDFAVEGQHNWIQFPLAVEPGTHEITARAGSGARLAESFEVPADEPRYAVIDHWGEDDGPEDDGPELSWLFQADGPAFD